MSDATSNDSRVAIVTGAAGALGTAMCERFVRDGIRVVVADVAIEPAQALADRLDPTGAAALAVAVDVADYATVEAMVQAVLAWSGRIDIMVNNAGIGEESVPTWEMPLAVWQRTIDIDLTGVFHGCRAVLPTMLERGWGRIINISSIAGKEGKHNPVAYAAAKAGVIGLTKAVAFEVAPHGHPRQCHHARHDRERELGEGQPGGHGRGHQAPSGRTRRTAARGRGARRVPGLRRMLVLDRGRVRYLGRPRGPLTVNRSAGGRCGCSSASGRRRTRRPGPRSGR